MGDVKCHNYANFLILFLDSILFCTKESDLKNLDFSYLSDLRLLSLLLLCMGLLLYFDETQNVIYSRPLANVIGIFLEHHISQNSCYRRP